MARIFISYRREDTEGYAGRLYDWLVRHFDEKNIFMDIDDIPYGSDFRNVIDSALSKCKIILVIIGPRWLSSADPYGRPRLDDPSDFVRLEIQVALQRGIQIIPVLVGGATMPYSDDLPDPIRDLAYANAFTLNHRGFATDVTRLVNDLEAKLRAADWGWTTLSQELFATRSFEPETVLVTGTSFIMGSNPLRDAQAESHEQPQHIVTLPRYRIGKYPVTVGQYRTFVHRGGYDNSDYWTTLGWNHREQRCWDYPRMWEGTSWAADDQLPVVTVSWYEALAYTVWLSNVTGRKYRLPTEAEWEHAARGTAGALYPWGDEWRERLCNTRETLLGHTTSVGRFSPQGDSPYGVADMSGNVLEWCVTKARPNYGIAEDNTVDGHTERVLRGGSYRGDRYSARTAARGWCPPYDWDVDVGFRVVCTLDAQ